MVDEHAVPNGGGKHMTLKVRLDEGSLFFQKVDEVNIAILAKVPLQLFPTKGIEVLHVSDVHVPCCARYWGLLGSVPQNK